MRKEVLNNKQVAYHFDSITEMQEFSANILSKIPVGTNAYKASGFLSPANILSSVDLFIRKLGERWFGTLESNWATKPLTNYNKIDELTQEVSLLRSKIAKVDVVDIDQVKRIQFTDKEVGIFSYDLASLGLIKVYEYYSPLFQTTVNANFVIHENGKYFFVGQKHIVRHEVKYNQDKAGFYSNILGRLVEKKDLEIVEQPYGSDSIYLYFYPEQLEIPRHEVEQRQKIGVDGKPMFTTTFKKCFINIEKTKKPLPRIDLVALPSFSNKIDASEIFYNAIAIISICEKLSKSNINYRILTSYNVQTVNNPKQKKYNGCKNYSFINVKNENQNLDINQLAILVSDARFYRNDSFRAKLAMQYDSGWEDAMDSAIGYPITDDIEVKEVYMQFLAKQTSQSDREAAKIPQTKIVIPIALNREEAEAAYDSVISQISRLNK